MPSFSQQINNSGQFIIEVNVFPPIGNPDKVDKAPENSIGYRALVDTGANCCSISEKIVSDLKLQPHSQQEMMTAGQPHTSFVYLAGITVSVTEGEIRPEKQKDGNVIMKPFPIRQTQRGLRSVAVTAFPDVGIDRGFDLILGMDILIDFHITIYSGNIIISI